MYPKIIESLILGINAADHSLCEKVQENPFNYLHVEILRELIVSLYNKKISGEGALLAAELLYQGGKKLINNTSHNNTSHNSLAVNALTHAVQYGSNETKIKFLNAFKEFDDKTIFKNNRNTIEIFMNIAGVRGVNNDHKRLCITFLGDAEVAEAVPLLIEIFPDTILQRYVAISLGKIGNEAAVKFLTNKSKIFLPIWPKTRAAVAAAAAGLKHVKETEKSL